jgi:hypothetical protein
MFKSKTVELGGNKFKITHKSSNILSSNIWLILGFVCYYLKIMHKFTLKPIIKIINDWADLLFFVFSTSIIIFVIIGIITFAVTSSHIEQVIHSCTDKNNDCSEIIKYCFNEINSLQNDLRHTTDIIWTCMHKPSNYWSQYFSHLKYWNTFIFYYFGLIIASFFALTFTIQIIIMLINSIIEKVINIKNNITENIPEIEMV